MKIFVILLSILILLVGCAPTIPESEPELNYIKMTPEHATILRKELILLEVKGFSEIGEKVSLECDKLIFTKCCLYGELTKQECNVSFVSQWNYGKTMIITAQYEELKVKSYIKIICN